ncbi:hypothetical protein [Neptuniibacter sp. QD37_11]|uniref:hypothetical protein n=1 Tax=Neptuniibacter sp. QD37_11 TaxID=3398209 RepID=UPI0039F642B7
MTATKTIQAIENAVVAKMSAMCDYSKQVGLQEPNQHPLQEMLVDFFKGLPVERMPRKKFIAEYGDGSNCYARYCALLDGNVEFISIAGACSSEFSLSSRECWDDITIKIRVLDQALILSCSASKLDSVLVSAIIAKFEDGYCIDEIMPLEDEFLDAYNEFVKGLLNNYSDYDAEKCRPISVNQMMQIAEILGVA